MKKIISYLLTLTITCVSISCSKDKEKVVAPTAPLDDNSLPSGAVVNVQLISKTNSSLEYRIDMAVFRDSKNIESQLTAGNFSIDTLALSGTKYYFQQTSLGKNQGGTAKPYSALLLMDQSGSIATTDPKDNRLVAAKTFCSNLGPGDNVMLWSFAAGSNYYSNDLVQHGTGFSSDTSILLPLIEKLRGKANGNTPLYFSQLNVSNYAVLNAPQSNKAVLTFTDGIDNGSANGYYTTMQNVVDNAKAKGLKIFNIGLQSAETESLCFQAMATGGAFMFAENARQLISMFGNLGKLLNATAGNYHSVWKITKNSGNFTSGKITHKVKVSLPNGSQVYIPFSLNY